MRNPQTKGSCKGFWCGLFRPVDNFLSSQMEQRTPENDFGTEIPGEFEVIGWIEEKERKGMLLEESDKLLLRIYRKYGTLL